MMFHSGVSAIRLLPTSIQKWLLTGSHIGIGCGRVPVLHMGWRRCWVSCCIVVV